MTYKQIEASREARLWITQVIVPTALIVATAMSIPEVKQTVVETTQKIKESIKSKFKKD